MHELNTLEGALTFQGAVATLIQYGFKPTMSPTDILFSRGLIEVGFERDQLNNLGRVWICGSDNQGLSYYYQPNTFTEVFWKAVSDSQHHLINSIFSTLKVNVSAVLARNAPRTPNLYRIVDDKLGLVGLMKEGGYSLSLYNFDKMSSETFMTVKLSNLVEPMSSEAFCRSFYSPILTNHEG